MNNDLYYGIVRYLSTGKIPDTLDKETQRMVTRTFDLYALNKTALYKRDDSRNGTHGGRQHRNHRLVIPRTQLYPTLKLLHDSPTAGHQGQDNTYHRAIQHYYWPGIKNDIINYVRSCKICQKRSPRRGEAPLEPIPKHPIPFYQISIDVQGPLPRTLSGKRYIVVAIDHFTKWIEARALEEADAQTITHFLYEDIICRHGVPTLMTSDRGTEFVNEMITALADVYKIKHIRTTAYHPQGNGQVERANKTIKDILAKVMPPSKKDWSHYLPSALFVIRTTRQQSTRFSPSELLYGCQVRHPFQEVDLNQEQKDPIDHAQEEFDRLRNFRAQAHAFIKRAQERQKISHDTRVQLLSPLKIGDLVLVWQDMIVANMSMKLEKKYKGPYRIHNIKGTTYWLKNRHNGSLLPKPFHRNRLRPYTERQILARRPVVEIPIRRSRQKPSIQSSHYASARFRRSQHRSYLPCQVQDCPIQKGESATHSVLRPSPGLQDTPIDQHRPSRRPQDSQFPRKILRKGTRCSTPSLRRYPKPN